MTFINFDREKGGFVGIVREKFAARFSKRFPEGLGKELTGKEVRLEGTITLYRGTPQIELESPDQIHRVP
jgi:DNA/RNA endonuclease YhcR with UshA esterase domain